MRKLLVNGIYEDVPPFPHPKDYAHRCAKFFGAKSLMAFTAISRFQALRELMNCRRFRCAIPRDILLDPTNACNMHCKGCWAGSYASAASIPYERWDALLSEAKELGTMDILYTGGEPLVRKDEILSLAKKHNRLFFGAFTNGTLVDEEFVKTMRALGNITLFVSIEGYKAETDFRRGEGAYERILHAMELLKRYDIAYGFSLCYHKKNYELVTSDAFLDFLRERGAWFGWAFGYRPIGHDADMSLVLSPKERAYVANRFNEYAQRHSFTIIDLFNNGHKIFGCVGGGNGYLHINANGDVEPCAFCHYSDANINDMSLQQALQSPFLRAFRNAQPFSDNPFTPCPLYDNPEKMVELSEKYHAVSTHFPCGESAADFADKVKDTAKEWHALASNCYAGLPKSETVMFRKMKRVVGLRNYLAGDHRMQERETHEPVTENIAGLDQ
ncbi:MAG: radical SAM protein [Candidatus Pelethousia sp.]|nr:radical SAM protein [Candidatus Pelethousia sp.]